VLPNFKLLVALARTVTAFTGAWLLLGLFDIGRNRMTTMICVRARAAERLGASVSAGRSGDRTFRPSATFLGLRVF